MEIARVQATARQSSQPAALLDRLGWLFIAKARSDFDNGYYNLAEQCALCLKSSAPRSPEALLLRGHVLHSQHRFREAEVVARELVAVRGLWFDHALLGDVLMEQGKLDEATDSYQVMVDQKPNLQTYSRAAHMRWLRGDRDGAIEIMEMAVRAGSPRIPEPTAWAYTRLASYQWQTDQTEGALQSCGAALELISQYAPALLLRGRIQLAAGNVAEAVGDLQRANASNPLPEYQWTLAESLRACARVTEAEAIERELTRRGPAEDPRTMALFLATRHMDSASALRLARAELNSRADVFTHDALAWSLAAAGELEEARCHMTQALAEGTQDARFFFHATVIAVGLGRWDEAASWSHQASSSRHTLLPSEREALDRCVEDLATRISRTSASPSEAFAATQPQLHSGKESSL